MPKVRKPIQVSEEMHDMLKQMSDATGMTIERILMPLVKREHQRLVKKGVVKTDAADQPPPPATA